MPIAHTNLIMESRNRENLEGKMKFQNIHISRLSRNNLNKFKF